MLQLPESGQPHIEPWANGVVTPLGALYLDQAQDVVQTLAIWGQGSPSAPGARPLVYEAQGPWRVCDATCGYSGRRSGPSYGRGPVVTILSLVVALPWSPTERWWGRPQPGLRCHTTSQSPAASASGGISHWTDFWMGGRWWGCPVAL